MYEFFTLAITFCSYLFSLEDGKPRLGQKAVMLFNFPFTFGYSGGATAFNMPRQVFSFAAVFQGVHLSLKQFVLVPE